MKTCLFLCTFVALSLFVGMNQASKDDGELTDAQVSSSIKEIHVHLYAYSTLVLTLANRNCLVQAPKIARFS